MPLSLEAIRRHILIAMFSDDQLMDALVLKGGNALALVYQIGGRASVDIDFSMAESFPSLEDARTRIFAALRNEFSMVGYAVFDESFMVKPAQRGPSQPDWWGGYLVEFKLAEQAIFDRYRQEPDALRRHAAIVGPQQRRTYTIDISKYEYCEGKVRTLVDDYTVYVYSPEMIVIEKLRAICQQMPEYTITRNKTPRARDFYDIQQVVTERSIDLTSGENRRLIEAIFASKQVPLTLLERIRFQRNFHALDWPAVQASVSNLREGFDFFFDFVVEMAAGLETLWVK